MVQVTLAAPSQEYGGFERLTVRLLHQTGIRLEAERGAVWLTLFPCP
jgi:hypothetical protein